MNKRLNKQGFTLIELVVVMVIIGLMTSAVLPNVREWISGARLESRARDLIAAIHLARVTANDQATVAGICIAPQFSDCQGSSLIYPSRQVQSTVNKQLYIGFAKGLQTANGGWEQLVMLSSPRFGKSKFRLRAPQRERDQIINAAPVLFDSKPVYRNFPFSFAPDGAYLGSSRDGFIQGPGEIYFCDMELKRSVVVDIPEYGAARITKYIDGRDGDAVDTAEFYDGCEKNV